MNQRLYACSEMCSSSSSVLNTRQARMSMAALNSLWQQVPQYCPNTADAVCQPPRTACVCASLISYWSFVVPQEKGQLLENVFADPKGFGLDPSGERPPNSKVKRLHPASSGAR